MVDIEKLNVGLDVAAMRPWTDAEDRNAILTAVRELKRLRDIEEKAEAVPAAPGGCSLADWGNWFNRYGPLMETLAEDDMNELADLFCTLVDLKAAIAKPAHHSKEAT